jgi:hypothetical protein
VAEQVYGGQCRQAVLGLIEEMFYNRGGTRACGFVSLTRFEERIANFVLKRDFLNQD